MYSVLRPTTDRYVDGTYLDQNRNWHADDSPWKARQVLKAFDRAAVQPKTIAEVGCGAGAILAELQAVMSNDTSFVGYDISEIALKLCAPRANHRLQFNLADLTTVDKKYDVLLMLDVIEHVEDYFGFLRGLRGKADVKVAHFPLDLSVHEVFRGGPMTFRNSLGHLHYFNKDTALATLTDCGYKILDWFYTPKVDVAPRDLKSRISMQIRRLCFRSQPDWTVSVLGCYGLMVVAR